ncbi:CLUMA_CG005477, isoform A [Clunio marinus]|uniref:CLUMA_CG005477, isoform A n=1 Tax=Clunio marinus TaxID=568069 RepID=A0A1J1HUV3_9DIPT|nr:CLUMA_CG005477, isoform A [Clunio marinus]
MLKENMNSSIHEMRHRKLLPSRFTISTAQLNNFDILLFEHYQKIMQSSLTSVWCESIGYHSIRTEMGL